ncbi:cytochrome P450 [Lactarius akahatsu]|uniref:Cytochrome P450 n=1 Tax=Lactarius akahatsu TaxID=416441 RepID=A0AAD4L892_9AGAM|nr:cytochrome P450 [Lactarius akahatsu]
MFSLFVVAAYALVALAGAASLTFLRRRFRQRNLLKIPGPSNPSLFWEGHWHHIFNPYAYPFHEGLYKTYGKVARVYGFFGDIQLVISDPKACNNIFVKDQPIFEMTEAFLRYGSHFLSVPWTYTYIATNRGAQHRMQRKLLNPAFNIKHMRHMTPIFHRVTKQLRENLWSIVSNGPEEINVADWMGRLALELIGQAGLGYSFGIFEGRDDEYCRALKEWIPTSSSLAVSRNMFPYVDRIFHPKVLKFLGRTLPWPKLNHLIDLAETLNSTSRDIHEAKKRLLELGDDATVKQVGDGNDIISLLMRARLAEPEDIQLSEEELVAQMAVFLIAGTDTTSSALSRILQLLSLHPDVQDKLRKELKAAHEDNEELTHDQLVSLPFLEAVCRETLRLYAPVPGVMRTTRSDVVLPLSTPIRDVDGREVHEIFVPKNTNVFAQIYNLNRDPSIWGADAAEWKPERWLAPLPQSVADANIQGVYANTMTFIGGTRACIGFKFSQLEMKVVLSQIIPIFQFAPTEAEIVWRFGIISTPSVKGSVGTFHSKLPMIVSRV